MGLWRRGDILFLPEEALDAAGLGLMTMKSLGKVDREIVRVGKGDNAVIVVWTRPQMVRLRPMEDRR